MRRAAITAAVASAGVIGFANVGHAHSPSTHVVQSGETLSGIVGSNWAAVAAANGISDPNVIYPGQVINLDGSSSSGSSAPAPSSSSSSSSSSSPAPAPSSAPASSNSGGGTVWDRVAQCESSGDWSINTGNGYYGGLQFSLSSWQAAGGSGNPANASRAEQIRVAENLLDMQGWGAWPSCSSQLGLR